MADSNESAAAVYVAWTTFKNALDQLAQGIPNRIDRSVFPGLSGGVQAQLLAGMRFLGLIDADGKPQPVLKRLAVTDEAARKHELQALLEERYSQLFALDLTKTTPSELGEQMTESYNVTGATREKAVRFFLGAAEYLEISLSPLFGKTKRGRGGASTSPRRRRTQRLRSAAGSNGANPQGDGTSKTVTLKSGGELTLSATIDLFSLTTEDRKFVFELIDRMDSYEGVNQDQGERN